MPHHPVTFRTIHGKRSAEDESEETFRRDGSGPFPFKPYLPETRPHYGKRSAEDESEETSKRGVLHPMPHRPVTFLPNHGMRSAEDESEESSQRGVRTLLLGLLPGAIAVRTRLCFKD